jgi:hypothetical protein
MKYLLIALLLVTSAAFAATTGRDIMHLKNGVDFPHKAHQSFLKSECKQCHRKGEPGKIEGFGKDHAHRMCKTCHAMKNAGPTSCKDCHKNKS